MKKSVDIVDVKRDVKNGRMSVILKNGLILLKDNKSEELVSLGTVDEGERNAANQ